jgi:ankyrin repeat protein
MHAVDDVGQTPLYAAAQEGHFHIVQQLLEAGAYVNAAHAEGSTALYAAAAHGHLEVVQLLLAAGADVNEGDHHHDWNPLHAAAAAGYHMVVQLLLQAGASANAVLVGLTDSCCWIVADTAAAYDVRDSTKSNHVTVSTEHQANKRVLELLLAAGAFNTTYNCDIASASRLATERGSLQVVQALLAGRG